MMPLKKYTGIYGETIFTLAKQLFDLEIKDPQERTTSVKLRQSKHIK